METTAFHFHCPPHIGDKLHLAAGDDAQKVVWLDVNPGSEPRYASLYASHREWVDRVAIPGMTKLGDKVSKKFQEVTKR